MTYNERFLKTMIETLQYDGDNYINAQEVAEILSRSKLSFIKTSTFKGCGVQDQREENLQLKVPVPLLKKAREYKEIIEEIISEVYDTTEEYGIGKIKISPKIIENKNENISQLDVHFDRLEKEVIQGIRNAKYSIWMAIAWFTNQDIINELIEKARQGIDVKVIMSDEDSNQSTNNQLKKEGITSIVAPLRGYWNNNRMHHKFCIIDLSYVMNGSYNWSNNANYNDENLTTAVDKSFVLSFADEFMRLYNENR